MFGAFVAVGSILMIVGAIISLVNLFPDSGFIAWQVVNLGIGIFSVAFCLFAYSLVQVIKNYFVELRTQVKREEANVGILRKQYTDLVEKLESFVEKYFSHETSLLEAIKGRSVGNLAALFENYPELKAMGGTKELIDKIVSLRGKISEAQRDYNCHARNYNEYAQKTPYNKLIPQGLEEKFDYINPENN